MTMWCLSPLLGLLLFAASASAAPVGGPTEDATAVKQSEESSSPTSKPSRYTRLSLEELLRVRVVTASQQDESLREAPVPVTVITKDMIRAIGARNLQDVLTTYVPGMTLVADQNELNLAMRGIYGSSQQKILVMLDGHRLNSRAYPAANPDYGLRIDLDRVKQIEVLRGPGSSLYGNVALTAVVNVVTESGGAIDGLVLTAGGGGFISGLDSDTADHGLLAAGKSLGFTYGRHFQEANDLVLWGGWFRADGQEIPVARSEDYSASPRDGFAHVGAFKGGASYDVGLRYQTGSVTLLGNRRYGKYTEPFSAGGTTGEVYDPADYRSFRGKGPGFGSESNHLEIGYAPSLSEAVSLELNGYYDTSTHDSPQVSNPAKRAFAFVTRQDNALGGVVQLQWKYRAGARNEGTLLVGGQIDRMQLVDSALISGENGEFTKFGDTAQAKTLRPGRETVYSAFTQVKHKLAAQWIANAGLRFDVKDRREGPNITDVSPRLGLIWAPGERFDLKLSYAQSFVDAPYFYRYNTNPAYLGSQGLRPEHLRSFQLTPSLNLLEGRLRNTVNVFYNDVYDFIFRNNTAGPTDPKYINAGNLRSLGVEGETAYIRDAFQVRGVFTYQRVLDSKDFDARDNEVFNVPRFAGNLILDANALGRSSGNLWLNLTLRYTSDQLSPIAPTSKLNDAGQVVRFQDPNNRVPSCLLANLGLRVSRLFVDDASLSATVYNLFDKGYEQGGSVVHPYPQPGRSLVVTVTYRMGTGTH